MHFFFNYPTIIQSFEINENIFLYVLKEQD